MFLPSVIIIVIPSGFIVVNQVQLIDAYPLHATKPYPVLRYDVRNLIYLYTRYLVDVATSILIYRLVYRIVSVGITKRSDFTITNSLKKC